MKKKPIIADNKPANVKLLAGETYFFCTCGRSQSQPFCDGSHKVTPFQPMEFLAGEDDDAWLCQCKHSQNLPFCDGSHKQFGADQVGKVAGENESNQSNNQQNDAGGSSPAGDDPESTLELIQGLANLDISKLGHGPMGSMGVPRNKLPLWDDIQIMVAQLDKKPLMEDATVNTEFIIGPESKKPLRLSMPLFVSDMSFGALSEEAKLALAKGAQLAGTGICSGEGGMLAEEQRANEMYLYELASAMFGFQEESLKKVQAFHFKVGQGAKTGTGGHLPGAKVKGKIAQVRGLPEGQAAVSPPTFKDLHSPEDFQNFAQRIRDITGGIPIGFKMSANHIEADIEFALQVGVDYIILDGRGGGTGAAPLLFRDHISVPTIPALARARRYLDKRGMSGKVSLIITGGLRVPSDFIKALALGADGIALSNSAMQAIGCVAARMCNTNNCPAGVATQKAELRAKLNIDQSAQQLANFFQASNELIKVMARACGHQDIRQFSPQDLATWNREMAQLSGITYAGVEWLS